MDVAIHAQARDPNALIARCRGLGIRHARLGLNSLPGYADAGMPDQAYLRTFVRELADAGIGAPVAITWFGNDPDLVLRPASHRPQIDSKLRTLKVLKSAGIGVVLHYVDLAQYPTPPTTTATGRASSPSFGSSSLRPRPPTSAWPTTPSGVVSPTRCAQRRSVRASPWTSTATTTPTAGADPIF